MRASRRVVVGLAVLTLVALVALAGLVAWRAFDKAPYEVAVDVVPAGTLRATYTDWAQVRELAGWSLPDSTGEVGETGLSQSEVAGFLDRAFAQDLGWSSAVAGSTYVLAERYGVSPLNASWEVFGQSREGAVVVMRVPESVDLDEVEENLRSLGYAPPRDGAGSGPVWEGSPELLAQLDPTTTPVLQNVVVLPEERLVLMSDSAEYAATSAQVAQGEEPSLSEAVEGVRDLAAAVETPVAAVHYAADFACEDLSMATADPEDQVLGEQLVEDAGDISPLSGLVLAHQRDRTLRVVMQFESSEQAQENLRPRVELASGEAVGQGGTFGERFSVASAEASGDQVVLELEPREEESTLLSDLSQGPLLFATC